MRAIALGIVVTALVQAVVGGVGLAILGVPHPALLTAIMFLVGAWVDEAARRTRDARPA